MDVLIKEQGFKVLLQHDMYVRRNWTDPTILDSPEKVKKANLIEEYVSNQKNKWKLGDHFPWEWMG